MSATPETYRKLGANPGNRRPVAGVIRVGKKGPTGNPIESHGQDAGYYVVRAEVQTREKKKRDGGTYQEKFRTMHAAYSGYNDNPPADRRIFNAVLPYAELTRVWELRRKAKELKGYPRHGSLYRACQSEDGETAERLYEIGGRSGPEPPPEATVVEGKPDGETWYRLPCPGDLCQHTQRGECRTEATLYLIADEEGCPRQPLRFWTGGSKTTVQNIAAFFEDVEEQVRGLGLQLTNYSMIPVALQLGQGTGDGKRYAITTLILRDVAAVALKAQREMIAAAGGHLELPAVIDGGVVPEETEESKAFDAVDAAPGVPQSVVGDDDQPELFT